MAFVECAGGIDAIAVDQFFSGPHWTMHAWAGALWWSGYGICPNTLTGGPGQNCNNGPGGLGMSVFAAGGLHTGGMCNVAMGDGSVRPLSAPNIDTLSLVYLAGYRDGEIQSADF